MNYSGLDSQEYNSDFMDILKHHAKIDQNIINSPDTTFISTWQCEHPYYAGFTPKVEELDIDAKRYTFYSDDIELIGMISDMHKKFDNIDYSATNIMPGDGSSLFIASFCIWLQKNSIKEIYYIQPLYYTFYFFLKLFNIRARPISAKQAYEKEFVINLPNKQSCLLLCDPVWYAGFSLNYETIDKIKSWQKRTNSIVFVDGSLQYLKWDKSKHEYSSGLDKDLTIRLVCPTKFLAVHGYRFAYILVPELLHDELLFIYANCAGSTTAINTAFAKHAVKVISNDESNNRLIDYIVNIYNKLISHKVITENIAPNCGYFIFTKLLNDMPELIFHQQQHFEQKRFKNYVRINLLAPDLPKIFQL